MNKNARPFTSEKAGGLGVVHLMFKRLITSYIWFLVVILS